MSDECLTDTEPFSELKKIIVDEVSKYAKELRFDIDRHPLRLNECWLNIYGKGHSQDIHCHPNSVFSGIYYPKAPQGCGHLAFHSHLIDMMLEPSNRNYSFKYLTIPCCARIWANGHFQKLATP